MKDGNMFDRRDILRLSIPIMIDQISALLIGIIDSAMVSNCGEAAVSGELLKTSDPIVTG